MNTFLETRHGRIFNNYPIDPYYDSILKKVKYFVDANNFERTVLCNYYSSDSSNSNYNLFEKIKWESLNIGFSYRFSNILINNIEYPLVISFNFNILNNILICFYYNCSMIVNKDLTHKFLTNLYPIKYNKLPAITDAQNFYKVIRFIKEERNKRYYLNQIKL